MLASIRSTLAALLMRGISTTPQESALVGAGPGGSGFDAVNSSHRRGQVPGKGVVDYKRDFEEYDRLGAVEQSRYINKNSGLFRGYVRDMQTYSVGSGLQVQSKVLDDPEWITAALALWNSWARIADLSGRFSLAKIERLVCRAADVDGEIFVHKTYDEFGEPALQLIETHRVGDFGKNDSTDGIKYDSYGRVVWYRVLQDNGVLAEVPAAEMIHIADLESSSAARCGPSVMHALTNAMDESELLALEKHAVKDGADIARILTNESGELPDDGDFDPDVADADAADEAAGTSPASIQRIIGGKVIALARGEKMEQYRNERPSPTFTGFLEHLRRDNMQGLTPYEFTANPSTVGGAAVRLVVAKADRVFSDRQDLLIEQLLVRVWFFVIGHYINKGKLRAVPGWWEISAVTPRRITVDAGRDGEGNRRDIELGLKGLSDHYAENGASFEEEMTRRAKDIQFLQKLAKNTGVPFALLYNAAIKTPPQPAPLTAPAESNN